MEGMKLADVLWDYSDDPWFNHVDWEPVVSIDLGESYSWEEFHAWYSPSKRVFYYGSGSGCSCNSFRDDYRRAEDFEVTPRREELKTAAIAFVDQSYRPARDVATLRNEAIATINSYSPEPTP